MIEERIGTPSGDEQRSIRDEAFRVRESGVVLERDHYKKIIKTQRGILHPSEVHLPQISQGLVISPQDSENSLHNERQGELSGSLAIDVLRPIGIRPPEKIQGAWNAVTSGIISLKLGKEAIDDASTYLNLRREARKLGGLEATEELQLSAERKWDSLSEETKQRVVEYANGAINDPTPLELVNLYHGWRESESSLARTHIKNVEADNRENKNKVLRRDLESKVGQTTELAKGFVLGISAAVASVPAGVSEGVARGLSKNKYLGTISGSAGLGASAALTLNEVSQVINQIQANGEINLLREGAIATMLAVAASTSIQTLSYTLQRVGEDLRN